jgi:hypothetical protein
VVIAPWYIPTHESKNTVKTAHHPPRRISDIVGEKKTSEPFLPPSHIDTSLMINI